MSQNLNEKSIQTTLIAYAVEALANWAREDATPVLQKIKQDGTVELDLTSYLTLLQGQDSSRKEKGGEFTALLSLLAPEEATKVVIPKSLAARPLSLDLATLSGSSDKDGQLWTKFKGEFEKLPDNEWRFEAFSNLFYKYVWAVPCTYGERGISLYEEFKALAALVYASNGSAEPAEKFLLVGGDISGIQNFIYTVSHKMAARGLRGRSFFLQLVSDALVRRILQQLGLRWTNVVYTAGGTFLILAPNGDKSVEKLKTLQKNFNQILLTETQGQFRVAIGWVPVGKQAMGEPEIWRDGVQAMHKERSKAKRQPFGSAGWDEIFQVIDEGGERYCAICHRGLQSNEGKELKIEGNKTEWACDLCFSFGNLADAIREDKLWLVVKPETAKEKQKSNWSNLLVKLSEHRYEFISNQKNLPANSAGLIYAMNEPDFLKNGAYDFRLLANVTPRMTDGDVIYAKDNEICYEGKSPQKGHVRDLDVIARDGKGVEWVGVLRMDVDNLGAVFSQWGPGRALAGTSALSSAMDRFFSGRLNRIVRDVATVEKGTSEERLTAYLIYAGGDDLFIIGAWDKMVDLAERIQQEFREYTGNPNLTISAGISLLDRPKFPLYLAAKQAKKALDDKAKANRWEVEHDDKNGAIREKLKECKNAICFLDTVVGWERWPKVKELQEMLVDLAVRQKTPRSLIQLIRNIHALYERGRKEYEDKQRQQGKRETEIRNYPMFHGRWMWLAAYQLARMKEQYKHIATDLENIHQLVCKPEVTPYSGLAARWAEYLSREKEKNG